MILKTTITLILGLVFQLAQVLPGAVVFTNPCSSQAESCECCKAASSCHCAENSGSDQERAPTPIDTAAALKITAAKQVETKVSADPLPENDPPAIIAAFAQTGAFSGFTGVSLSVAFCRFVI